MIAYKIIRSSQHSKFALDIRIVTNSFTLPLRSDLQTIQHITVKDILDENIFYSVTPDNRLQISNFDLINCIIPK